MRWEHEHILEAGQRRLDEHPGRRHANDRKERSLAAVVGVQQPGGGLEYSTPFTQTLVCLMRLNKSRLFWRGDPNDEPADFNRLLLAKRT